jgi:hypothetical protein
MCAGGKRIWPNGGTAPIASLRPVDDGRRGQAARFAANSRRAYLLPARLYRFAKAAGDAMARMYPVAKTAGAAAAVDCVKIELWRSDTVRSIRAVGAAHPLWARTRSSDLYAFLQIFVRREYECLNLIDGDLILDLGANVGYSSAYFLSRYPKSPVVAVEPDPRNFAMLQRNLAPYGSRATVIQAAVWSHSTKARGSY